VNDYGHCFFRFCQDGPNGVNDERKVDVMVQTDFESFPASFTRADVVRTALERNKQEHIGVFSFDHEIMDKVKANKAIVHFAMAVGPGMSSATLKSMQRDALMSSFRGDNNMVMFVVAVREHAQQEAACGCARRAQQTTIAPTLNDNSE